MFINTVFRLGILDYLSRRSVYFRNFSFGQVKIASTFASLLPQLPNNTHIIASLLGPVCVVSIAGPCRKGKSYILSKAFDQGEVFPLGHFLDPETMGIWMWIVPEKLKVFVFNSNNLQ